MSDLMTAKREYKPTSSLPGKQFLWEGDAASPGAPTVMGIPIATKTHYFYWRSSPVPLDFRMTAEELEERESWTRFGLENLAACYGDDEPDYSLVPLREMNPEYDAG